jgi:RNA polymerase sigma-70 factor, ECF subfamily
MAQRLLKGSLPRSRYGQRAPDLREPEFSEISCNRTGPPGVWEARTMAAGTLTEDPWVSTRNFTDLYSSSFARLVGQVTVVTADRAAAEDAVQEAFGRLWKKWELLGSYDNPEAWVRRVAINLAISRWRRLRRLQPLTDTSRSGEDDPATRHDVQKALQGLPMKQRQALLLHHVLGLPVAEVAREMKAPEGTVKSWLFRGREVLQRTLGTQEEAPHG